MCVLSCVYMYCMFFVVGMRVNACSLCLCFCCCCLVCLCVCCANVFISVYVCVWCVFLLVFRDVVFVLRCCLFAVCLCVDFCQFVSLCVSPLMYWSVWLRVRPFLFDSS